MATISDVARRAGVSKATVSRVLNGIPVRDESKQRVLAAVKELDYQPNAQARSLTSGKTNVVGVLVPILDNPFYGPILEGCQQTLLSYGYNMMVCLTYHRKGNEWTFAKLLSEKRVDGLLIITPREIRDEPMREFLRVSAEDGFPIVVADGEMDAPAISGVWIDNYEGGYRATEHLLELGHRRIGLILGVEGGVETLKRYQGYRQALRQWGVPFDPNLVVSAGAYSSEAAQGVTPRLLEASPTAIFATADTLALGVMEVARQRGINIPADLSIVGYDDIAYARVVSPKLTTISQPLRQLGKVGARKLVKIISGEEPEITKITLPIDLVIRETTAPWRHDRSQEIV